MIVGTAGHIDHGKTTLVRALTGVDTDRLPEEKKRGISIELGYAFLDLPAADGAAPGARIGFIDVPGHERLVHTMLAGATGIDFALLLVAADDGVMPQTREHLAVLSLLGLARGAVAITKCDRVEPARIQALSQEVAALLQGTSLAGAPVLPVSAVSGHGLPALRELLVAAARALPARHSAGQGFRLAIDRAFSLDGVGTVATGTVHAGRLRVGDEVALCPDPRAGAQPRVARVRSLHAQNQAVDEARAGQRCAVGLVGLGKDDLARGQWLVAPEVALSTDRLDLRLRLWRDEEKGLRSGTSVHVHLGARTVMGSVAVLGWDGVASDSVLRPGEPAWVQLVLREPVGAWRGDRVVLRDASATRTLAGGVVLDPFAPVRYRRTPERLAELAALQIEDRGERLRTLLQAAPQGLDLRRLARAEGQMQVQDGAGLDDGATLLAHEPGADWALSAAHGATLAQRVQEQLAAFHQRQPDELGPEAARLRRLAAPRLPEPLWRALLARLREQGRVAQRGAFVHLPEHGVTLSAVEQRIAQKIAPALQQAGFEGAWARDLARDAQESEALMRATLARLSQQGELHQVVRDLVYSDAHMRELARRARELAQVHQGQVLAADFRDATGLGRKRAIQILEYFDRVGLLRRVGDVHKLRVESSVFSD